MTRNAPRLPYPLVLHSACVVIAALASWTLPLGEYDRVSDEITDTVGALSLAIGTTIGL